MAYHPLLSDFAHFKSEDGRVSVSGLNSEYAELLKHQEHRMHHGPLGHHHKPHAHPEHGAAGKDIYGNNATDDFQIVGLESDSAEQQAAAKAKKTHAPTAAQQQWDLLAKARLGR